MSKKVDIGYGFSITEEQAKGFRNWSIEKKLKWLESLNKFLNMIQTEEEKKAKFIFKGEKYGVYTPGYEERNPNN